jgi:hypothetical protein
MRTDLAREHVVLCIFVCVCVCARECLPACLPACLRMCVCVCACAHVILEGLGVLDTHTQTHTQTHSHTQTHCNTHTHTRTHRSFSPRTTCRPTPGSPPLVSDRKNGGGGGGGARRERLWAGWIVLRDGCPVWRQTTSGCYCLYWSEVMFSLCVCVCVECEGKVESCERALVRMGVMRVYVHLQACIANTC